MSAKKIRFLDLDQAVVEPQIFRRAAPGDHLEVLGTRVSL
jgi:hypothetical protein